MEQYGFVVPGNPHDRVEFPPGLLQDCQGWMSHKTVKVAAQTVKLQQQQQRPAPAAAVVGGRVDAAVASILQARGWRNAGQYRATDAATTAQCAAAMLDWVKQELGSEASTPFISSSSSSSRRSAAAAQYCEERRQLLAATAQVLNAIVVGGAQDGTCE